MQSCYALQWLFALGKKSFQVGNNVRHCRAFSGILVPHSLDEVYRLGTPVLAKSRQAWPFVLLPDGFVNVMLIVTFPGIFLLLVTSMGYCPYLVTGPARQHFPVNQRR